MRRKQQGPELKLFELDTLKYVTQDNIRDSIYYIGIFPERMSPADVTFARKSGLLDTSCSQRHLSKVALCFILGAMTFREYAFLMLSKQWVKITNIDKKPTIYKEPLLPFILNEIQNQGHISKASFTMDMDRIIATKYAPIMLSNSNSLRYIQSLLVASELIVVEEEFYVINPLATAIVQDIIANRDKILPPTIESEYETYWNTMQHGVFDFINDCNKSIYSNFYPNLIK